MMETTRRATRQAVRLIVLCLTTLLSLNSMAQVGSWRAFPSYYEPQQIVKADNILYVRASNGLYSYNLNDQSITTYDKVKQLNDAYITLIAWNPTVKRLIIVYQNSNIDLLDNNGNVYSISSLYTKSMTQNKTVFNINIYDKYAYLSTYFGVVKVNMERAEIAESYILDHKITFVDIRGEDIYLKNQGSSDFWVIKSNTYLNLIDPHNWKYTSSYPDDLFIEDLTDWNENIDLVKTLKPDGPKHNYFGFMRFKNGSLYTVGGGYSPYIDYAYLGTPQVYNEATGWTFYEDDVKSKFTVETDPVKLEKWTFVANLAIDVDPLDQHHVFVSGRSGLYEYYDGELKNYYNKDNSMLLSATGSNRYVLVEGMSYDGEGNLWLVQSQTANNLIEITKDGKWVDHNQGLLMDGSISLGALRGLVVDSRGYIWFTNYYWGKPSFYCYDPQRDQIVSYMLRLVNQDHVSAAEQYDPRCIVEDLDGNMWLGTAVGLYLIESERIGSTLDYVTQVKVPRNDGTDYADYLMAGTNISCIAVDGANRKWIGTAGAGLYLISADNMEQVQYFTTENSPLLSNTIESLAINHQTGEVFIGTDQGLCSYMGDATGESIEMVKDNVYAYPNPVVSGYDGLITIAGLTRDADVKILSTSGQLVAQGRSNGGIFTWNGRDRSGKRVATGVYMVATATSDGKKGTVCKIAVIH